MKTYLSAILLLISASAMAASSAGYGNGGQLVDFDPIVTRHNQTGELFRIEGHCQSACTLLLGIRNVCIDPAATLSFRAGHDWKQRISGPATTHLMSAYNAKLRTHLMSNHYMNTLEFHVIPGRELIQKFGYRECPGG
jgi:hypothetical protein